MKIIRIVIADDHPVIRLGLSASIEHQSDMKVVGQAGNGLEALAVVKHERPDVILLDLSMPILGGLDAIPRILETSPETKILVLTSTAESDQVIRVLQAGASGYILKYAEFERLWEAIRTVADGQQYLNPAIAFRLVHEMIPKSDVSKPEPPKPDVPKPESSRANALPKLTGRETQTLLLLAQGKSNDEIAEKMVIKTDSAAKNVGNLLRKLNLENRTQAALYAVNNGLVNADDSFKK